MYVSNVPNSLQWDCTDRYSGEYLRTSIQSYMRVTLARIFDLQDTCSYIYLFMDKCHRIRETLRRDREAKSAPQSLFPHATDITLNNFYCYVFQMKICFYLRKAMREACRTHGILIATYCLFRREQILCAIYTNHEDFSNIISNNKRACGCNEFEFLSKDELGLLFRKWPIEFSIVLVAT